MAYCIPRPLANKFKEYLKSGKITPDKLVSMSSAERRALFSEIVGESDAKEMNAALESKLILKDQQRGLVTWLKQTSGLTPETRRGLIEKVSKMESVLQPENERAFLEDLASKKLGADISMDEAKKIAELSKAVRDTQESISKGGDRLAYGRAKVDLTDYVNHLKQSSEPKFIEKLKSLEYLKHPVKSLSEVAGTSKAINASMDNSAIFRQGWKTMFTNPAIWLKNSRQTFVDAVKTFGGQRVMREVQAEIQSRPTFDKMQKAKLDTGSTEEQFPTHLPEKIPVLGRFYKASEAAYTGFVYRMRADVFDKYLNIAKEAGVDINDKEQLESIGKLVNSLTGRGNLGKAEPAARVMNNVFFSPRFLKSNIDFLTAHQFQKDVTPFVRKQALENLLKVVVGTSSVLAIANAIAPGSVEKDPRSSNFGKIKSGNATFDVTGGMGSILVLAARLATMSSKSATTGKVTSLNSGKYGKQTALDVVENFAEGKLSPLAGVARDILNGQDYNHNKPTIINEIKNLFTPIPVQNAIQLLQSKDSPALVGIIADMLGISVNVLGNQKPH